VLAGGSLPVTPTAARADRPTGRPAPRPREATPTGGAGRPASGDDDDDSSAKAPAKAKGAAKATKRRSAPTSSPEEQLGQLHRDLVGRRRSLAGLPLESLVRSGDDLLIRLPPGDLLRDVVERSRDVIEAALAEHCGDGLRLRVVDGPARESSAPAPSGAAEGAPGSGRARGERSSQDEEVEALRSHPKVQAVLEIFSTDIESVETVGDSENE
jgi:hypothetical protein